VLGEVLDWRPHSPQALRDMRDKLDRLQRQGVEAIND
jgi:rifampin ADP-ribosylating transferase